MIDIFQEISYLSDILICFIYSFMCVGCLYIIPSKYDRDHPNTIYKRVFSMTSTTAIIFIIEFHLFYNQNFLAFHFIRFDNIIPSVMYPLLVTLILFSGPIVQKFLSKDFGFMDSPKSILFRNLVFGPLNEEMIFRSYLLFHLCKIMSCNKAILIAPLFFGIAHLHHMNEHLKRGYSVTEALLTSLFQFSYTTIFGIYSGFLVLRTGNIMSGIIAHTFCNFMGFPDFFGAINHPKLCYRFLIVPTYCMGLTAFIHLVYQLTQPALFNNQSDIFQCIW